MWGLCNLRECECQHSKASMDAELECHLRVAKPKEITLGDISMFGRIHCPELILQYITLYWLITVF